MKLNLEGRSFQGLAFTADLEIPTDVFALTGLNGSGKSRLLQAILAGNVPVRVNEEVIAPHRILLLTTQNLTPSLSDTYSQQEKDEKELARAIYSQYKGRFSSDPKKSAATLGSAGTTGRGQTIGPRLAEAVSFASKQIGIDVNELDPHDVADFMSLSKIAALGSLEINGTMLAYFQAKEDNEYRGFQNTKRTTKLPYLSEEQFLARFGPPPWEILNQLLNTLFGKRYYFDQPTYENKAVYRAVLRREDETPIDSGSLSSGEKVLMWLCLSMYALEKGQLSDPPQLLLLDEPDVTLHPKMAQKLLQTLAGIRSQFSAKVIFTTHSPTTIALFDDGPIVQMSETAMTIVEKDIAISDLLVGVEHISVQPTNRRQVFVESYRDAIIYGQLHEQWSKTSDSKRKISLAFIPAAPKVPEQTVRDLLKSKLQIDESNRTDPFVAALNGLSSSSQVIGAVESLSSEGNLTVRGIVDWDRVNAPGRQLHVLGEGVFYAIENAILNPLTLGLFLLHNHHSQLDVEDYGLPKSFSTKQLYNDQNYWQFISDGVTRIVIGDVSASDCISVAFISGTQIQLDKNYLHMQGHKLEEAVRQKYPFLKSYRGELLNAVIQQGIGSCAGESMPSSFDVLFRSLQI